MTDPASGGDTKVLPGGVEAPRLGLGTFQLEGSACRRTVERALALGYRHVDTAEGYGNERQVGRAVHRSSVPRDRLFLVSKIWRDHLRPDDLRHHLEGSLERLGTDYLDLYLVHWPNSDIPAAETAGALERARSRGLVRAWGVSNFTGSHLEEMGAHGVISTNQVELHPFFRQSTLRTCCRRQGVPLTAYSPLARGRVLEDPVLRDIAAGRGRSAAQVALRWSLQRGHLVIPKASSDGHLEDNLGALDLRLNAAEMAAIDDRPRGERLFDYEWSEFDR